MRRNESEFLMSAPLPTPRLDIVSDVICPWCYVGKHRLSRALAQLGEFPLEIRWRPYELNPGMPREGMSRRDYCERKFGSWEHARRLYARVEAVAAEDGLPLHVDRIARTPNTRRAHRLIEHAASQGLQDTLVDALFQAYFVDGRDVGDTATLQTIGVAVGLDPKGVAAVLADDAHDTALEAAEQSAREAGVDGVPAFFYNGRLLFSGAQSADTIALLLTCARTRGL